MKINTAIISHSTESYGLLKGVLSESNYEIVLSCTNVGEFVSQKVFSGLDLLVLTTKNASKDLITQLTMVDEQYQVPIVIFTQDDSDDAIEHAIAAGVSAYVVDGLQENRVIPILRTSIARYSQRKSMLQELDDLKTSLADRKIIDRAKGLIMTQRQCTEDEAYKLLRSSAMNQNIRLATLAKNIVDAASLLNPSVN